MRDPDASSSRAIRAQQELRPPVAEPGAAQLSWNKAPASSSSLASCREHDMTSNPQQSTSPTLEELLDRVAQGDQQASAMLVQFYEPAIRRVIRLRLANLPLKSIVDSEDVCQSVMASFLLNVQDGRYQLENEKQLMGLLLAMARSKVAAQLRFHQATKRDRRRLQSSEDIDMNLERDAACQTPSQQVEAKELIEYLLQNMNEDEIRIAQMRADGRNWRAIAESLQTQADSIPAQPDTIRKRWSRAMQRIIQELGLS